MLKDGGETVKVLPAICSKLDLEEHLFIFIKEVGSNNKYMLNEISQRHS